MRKYTPRRAGKRWLAHAPAHILDCFRSPFGTYEVFYTGPLLYPLENRTAANCCIFGREMSADPTHPQGIGLWFEVPAWEAARYRYRNGKRRLKWEDLPEKVKACAIADGQSNN